MRAVPVWHGVRMRITCFVIGTLCLLFAGVWVGIGMLDLANGAASSTSTPSVANLRMTQAPAAPSVNIDDFGPATTFAQIFTLAGVAWMVGALVFTPRQSPAPAAADQRQWQPQQQYAPQWQQQNPQQFPDSQS